MKTDSSNLTEKRAQLSITILGSGTCVPSLKRSACAVCVDTGGSKILLDCGPGTMRRLLESGTTIFDITHIFLSHFHPDHTSELVPLLFATKYPDNNRRKTPLTVLGGKGFRPFFQGLKKVYGEWIDLPPGVLDILALEADTEKTLEFTDFHLTAAPVNHRPESLAYRITAAGGRTLVYSGDTDMSENLVALAQGTDLLICESAFPDELKVPGHLTPSQAGDIATRAKVRRLTLTHFYPECDQADLSRQCRRTYAGPLVLAEDLMTLDL